MSLLKLKLSSQNSNSLYRDRNLLIVICIMQMSILPMFSITPALPIIGQALDVSSQQIGLVMSAYLVPVAIGTPILGVLADRIGRKKILVPSLLIFAIAGILAASASDFRSLIEWRCLQGIGAASLEASVLSTLSDLYSGKRLTAAMATNASAIGIGATIYPAIGGALADISWRLPFLLSFLAMPVALLVLLKLKLPSQAIKINDIELKTYVQRIGNSVNNRQVIALLLTVIGLFAIEFGAFYTYTPILAGKTMMASGRAIGMIFSSNSISLALVAFLVGLFASNLSEVKLIKVSLIIFAASLLVIFQVPNIGLLLIPSILIGAVEGMAFPSLQSSLAKFAPEGFRAGFMAMNVSIQAFGRALGPIIAALALKLGGMPAIFYGGAGLTFALLLVFHLLFQPQQQVKDYSTLNGHS